VVVGEVDEADIEENGSVLYIYKEEEEEEEMEAEVEVEEVEVVVVGGVEMGVSTKLASVMFLQKERVKALSCKQFLATA